MCRPDVGPKWPQVCDSQASEQPIDGWLGRITGGMFFPKCLDFEHVSYSVFPPIFQILGSLLFSFGLWILFDRNSFATVLGES